MLMPSKGQTQAWAEHGLINGLIKRGPFWLVKLEAKVKGLIIPLLEDQSSPGTVEEPAQQPVVIFRSSKHGDVDISTQWRDYLFWSVQDDTLVVQGGDIKFMLLQAKEDSEETAKERDTPTN